MKNRDREESRTIVGLIGNIGNRPDIREVQNAQIDCIEEALTRAREEGRQEILARMPSDVEIEKQCKQFGLSDEGATLGWGYAKGVHWLRNRLEGKT